MIVDRIVSNFAGELCPEICLPQNIFLLNFSDENNNRADWTKILLGKK